MKNQEIWKAKISEIEERYVLFITKAFILCLDFALLHGINPSFYYKMCDVEVKISFYSLAIELIVRCFPCFKFSLYISSVLHFLCWSCLK